MFDSDVDRDSEPEFVPVASYGFYEWINRHPWSIAAVLVVLAVGLAALYGVVADQSEPSFDPKGPFYDTPGPCQRSLRLEFIHTRGPVHR